MIYIYPIGGLGNMFFHIASIYVLAKDNNDELGLLNIEEKINHLINDKRGDLKHAPIFKYIFNRFPNVNKIIDKKILHTFKYSDLVYKNEHEYVGYFQCEKYFKHRRNELIKLFSPDDSFLAQINNYSELFGNISLHVRRNDYVTLYPEVHPPQKMDYYNKAISMLPENLKILIFSDDINWCKENFMGDRFVFINEKDYVSIHLMAKMKYHIIANSSFSWWGAWLSEYDDKIIIAPNNWFGNNGAMANQDIDLIPKSWIKI